MFRKLVAIYILILCMFYVSAYAFDDQKTHRDLTEASINNSNVNRYLVAFVGYSSGVKQVLSGVDRRGYNQKYEVKTWLQEGSTDEDHPLCRATNHFHNPIHSGDWSQSKMSDSVLVPIYSFIVNCGTKYSNVTWATGYTGSITGYTPRDGQEMGWDNARTYLLEALTSTDPAIREENFVKTFKSVGMVVHLLQDMAVPAHVRNDMQSHLFNSLTNPSKWGSNPFEKYVVTHSDAISTDPNPFKPTFAPPLKLTDFWDNNTYTGENPTADTNQGIAEYTNANFVSDFTIFKPQSDTKHYFKYPSKETSVDEMLYTIADPIHPGQTTTRRYYQKTRDGDTGYRLAGVGFVNRWSFGLPPFKRVPPMDDNVHEDYAKKILPRAVGYSAALLDYFFRGTIDLQVVPDNTTFHKITVTAKNTTTNGDEMLAGQVSLVIRYKEMLEIGTGPMRILSLPSDEYKYRVITLPDPIAIPKNNTIQLTFELSADPLPLHITDVTLQLVYKGYLGNENGAVAVGSYALEEIGTDIDVSLPASGVYAKTTDGPFNELKVTAQTDIPGGLSLPDGVIELVLEYRVATGNPFVSLPVNTEPQTADSYIIRIAEKNGVNTLPQGTPAELEFDLSSAPLPLWTTDVYVNVVYRRSGDPEAKLLAVGHNDIAEPTPVDIFNNTDKSCVNGTWYNSGNEALLAADLVGNNNGLFDEEYLYSAVYNNIYYKAGATGSVTPDASESNNNLSGHALGANQLLRLGYILTDYQFDYTISANGVNSAGMNTYLDSFVPHGTGFMNQQDRGWNLMGTIRGVLWWPSAGAYITPRPYPPGSTCYIKDLPP